MILFPIDGNELYQAGLVYSILHIGGTLLRYSLRLLERSVDSHRAHIITRHVRDSHRDKLRDCLEADCVKL